jgi:hypothetical protein
MSQKTDFDCLRNGFCTSQASGGNYAIRINFKSLGDMHAGFGGLTTLMAAEINRIDSAIDKSGIISLEDVNVQPVHDFGCEVEP